MREVAGAIVVLAGAVLVAAGCVADAINPGLRAGSVPTVCGIVVGLVGFGVLFAGAVRRAWDAIPADDRRTAPPRG